MCYRVEAAAPPPPARRSLGHDCDHALAVDTVAARGAELALVAGPGTASLFLSAYRGRAHERNSAAENAMTLINTTLEVTPPTL